MGFWPRDHFLGITVKTALYTDIESNRQSNNILALVWFILRSACMKIIKTMKKAEVPWKFYMKGFLVS